MTSSPRKPHVLVTLGPTWEFIDPIRFLTNRATGTLGYFIAQEALRRDCRVTCVAGPTALPPLPGVRWIRAVGAEEMYEAVLSVFPKTDVLIMTAAVSDYGTAGVLASKIKRRKKQFSLALKQTPDILQEVNRIRTHQILVGFALETEDLVRRALKKLKAKGLDLIVANLVGKRDHPFGDRTVNVHFLWKDGRRESFRHLSKRLLAKRVLDAVAELTLAR